MQPPPKSSDQCEVPGCGVVWEEWGVWRHRREHLLLIGLTSRVLATPTCNNDHTHIAYLAHITDETIWQATFAIWV